MDLATAIAPGDLGHRVVALAERDTLQIDNLGKGASLTVQQRLSPRHVKDILAGGLIPRLAEGEQ
jgi:aconitate hydratase